MDGRVRYSVIGLVEGQFPCASWVESFQDHGGPERAEECSPEDFSGEVCTNFLLHDKYLRSQKA